MNYLDSCISYASLGYDVSLTNIYGKDAIRMVKRYSYKAERELICEQVIDYDNLRDADYLHKILDFLYSDIQQQEETKEYYDK